MNKNKLFVLGLLLTFAMTTACSKKLKKRAQMVIIFKRLNGNQVNQVLQLPRK